MELVQAYALMPVVTHQWSGDPSIEAKKLVAKIDAVVTHQWSGDPSIEELMPLITKQSS